MLLGPKANLMPSRKTKNYFVSSLCDNGGGCAMSWRAQSRSKKWFRFSRARVIRCQVELGLCGIQRYPGTPPGHPWGTPKLDPGTPPGTAVVLAQGGSCRQCGGGCRRSKLRAHRRLRLCQHCMHHDVSVSPSAACVSAREQHARLWISPS